MQVELRGIRAHVPEALLHNCARVFIRLDRAKVARERAVLCADALELLRVRNKSRDLLRVPQRARPAEQRGRSCIRELRNLEVEERAPVARPATAHASPAQASLQDAEGQDFEILVVRARFPAGKAAAALLLCERTFPRRAVAHAIFRPSSLSCRVCALISRPPADTRPHPRGNKNTREFLPNYISPELFFPSGGDTGIIETIRDGATTRVQVWR